MSSNIDWNDTIKKEGFLIPQDWLSYDNDIVRFRISEGEISTKFREGFNPTTNTVQTPTTQDVESS